MARPSKSEREGKIHATALREFQRTQSGQREERDQCRDDRRFAYIAGAQWEGPLADQFKNKPKLEVNKVLLSIMRIANEYRNNRITVDFVSRDGTLDDDLADTCDSLYRADEQDSNADEAYDNAFDDACGGGFGAWRLRACYEDEEDEDNDHQRIRMEPIYDADTSVWFDANAKRQDKSDAKRCWVIYSMGRKAYEEQYDDDPASWPKGMYDATVFDWSTPDIIYLADYYEVEEVTENVRWIQTAEGDTLRLTDEELVQDVLDTGGVEVRSKQVKTRKVHKYLMSGGKILEDFGYIAGKYIPVIPVYGRRWFIDNVERCAGQARFAKDPQRLKNMQISKLAEISALSSVEKPILLPEQVAGHEEHWAQDNIKNWPYLLINPIEDAEGNIVPGGPVAYTRAPTVPQPMAALLQLTEADLSDILGNQEEGEKLLSNVSGDAIQRIQDRLDMQSFIYVSNIAKAMQWCGKVWLSMAKDIYVEEGRKMKGIGEMDNIESIELMKLRIDPDTGETERTNDFSRANFDVTVDVGPSFSSRRRAMIAALTEMMGNTADPETIQILQALILMNMEGEGLGDVRAYYRKKLVSMGVIQPNEEEQRAMDEAAANAQPSPNDQFLLATAEKERAEALKKTAETEKVAAEIDNIGADTDKKIAEANKIETEIV